MPARKIVVFCSAALIVAWGIAQPQQPVRSITGFSTPESVAVGPDGNYYVSNLGNLNAIGDGKVSKVTFEGNETRVSDFVTGLDAAGAAFFENSLYVVDTKGIWKIELTGQANLWLPLEKFPVPPSLLNDLAFDNAGNLYISDTNRSLIFRVTREGHVTVFLDPSTVPGLNGPNGLIFDAEDNLYIVDLNSSKLFKVSPDGTVKVLLESVGAGDGLAFDGEKNLYISDFLGRVLKLDLQGNVSVFAQNLISPADITIDLKRSLLVVPEFYAHRITLIPLK
jgi:DNA-binding beta-propeller fold protein YncE